MALQQPYDRPETGESYPAAYHRITHVTLNMLSEGAEIVVGIYLDAAARLAGKHTVAVRTHAAVGQDWGTRFTPGAQNPQGVNPVKSSYEYLKELPAYADALDV